MKISTRGRYGLRAMIDIASNQKNGSVTLKSVAKRQGLSENYLEQLMAPLKKAGLVKSIRGAQGGYILDKAAEEISVFDILMVLEGSLSPVECIESDSSECACGTTGCKDCITRPVWEKLYESVNDTLDNVLLSDLVSDYNNIKT